MRAGGTGAAAGSARARGAGTDLALPRRFFERPVVELARALVGQRLVRRAGGRRLEARIVEVEAYGGRGTDPSAHSYRGATARCAVMFGPAGHAYVYATQGRCFCLNVVAQGDRDGKAVLLRAAEPLQGADLMRRRRLARLADGPTRRRLQRGDDHILLAGPGRLCLGLGIDRRLDGVDLTDGTGELFLAAGGGAGPPGVPGAPVRDGRSARPGRGGGVGGAGRLEVRWTRRVGLNPASASHGWRWRAVDAGSPAVSADPDRVRRRFRAPWPARCPPPRGGP